jgi:trk system potassium uptake protein TrkH
MTVSRTICIGFIAVILAGALLLMLPWATASGQWNNPITALFTATSAVCVTGHIVVDTATYFSGFGQLVIMLLIQIGGLGYMTATTFLLLLLGRKFGLRDRLAIQQSMDRAELQGVIQLVRSIIATILVFEMTGMFLLMIRFVPDLGFFKGLWLALFHSVSAWNNAGFSLFSDNLIGYQSSIVVNVAITLLIIFGGIGYEVILEAYLWIRDRIKRNPHRRLLSLNFRVATTTTLFLLSAGTLALLLTEWRNSKTLAHVDFTTKVLGAWFQSVTSRTAGFNTIDIGAMTPTGLFFIIALMFIGGSPGGTAGGVKTTTIRVISSCTQSILQGKEEVLLYKRKVPMNLTLKGIGVVFGSIMTVILGTILITISDPNVDFIRILFEVVSAFGTVGLSTGITADLSDFAKLTLVGIMYVGRVGVLLLMSAILGDPKPTKVHYPEESLLVG